MWPVGVIWTISTLVETNLDQDLGTYGDLQSPLCSSELIFLHWSVSHNIFYNNNYITSCGHCCVIDSDALWGDHLVRKLEMLLAYCVACNMSILQGYGRSVSNMTQIMRIKWWYGGSLTVNMWEPHRYLDNYDADLSTGWPYFTGR